MYFHFLVEVKTYIILLDVLLCVDILCVHRLLHMSIFFYRRSIYWLILIIFFVLLFNFLVDVSNFFHEMISLLLALFLFGPFLPFSMHKKNYHSNWIITEIYHRESERNIV